jgi:hypothetical protein
VPPDHAQNSLPSFRAVRFGLFVASAAMGGASLVLQNVTVARFSDSEYSRMHEFAAIVAGIGFLFAIGWAASAGRRSAIRWVWTIAVLGVSAAVLGLSLTGLSPSR